MIFLADLDDYQAMNEVYGSYFPQNPPARACVQARPGQAGVPGGDRSDRRRQRVAGHRAGALPPAASALGSTRGPAAIPCGIGRRRCVAAGYPRSMRISLASSPRQMSRFHSSLAFGRYASHIAA